MWLVLFCSTSTIHTHDMTTYGTIPSSSSRSLDLHSILRARERIKAGLLNHRQWKIMFNFRSFGIPRSVGDLSTRVQVNFIYFRINYFILLNLGLFLYSLCNPISIIVFAVYIACSLYWLFLRDEPLVILGHPIDDRVVMVVMCVFYVVLVLTVPLYVALAGIMEVFDVQVRGLSGLSILWILPLPAAVGTVNLHLILRKTDDLSLDEEQVSALTAYGDSNLRREQRIRAGLRNYRPWKTMFNFRSFGIPLSVCRVHVNLMYFGVNYMVLLNLGMFQINLSVIYVIQFLVINACWLYLRFLRDEPLVILGHPINDRDMVVVMLVYYVALLWLLDILRQSPRFILYLTLILWTVQMHAILRKTDDLSLEEEAAAAGLTPAGVCILILIILLGFITSSMLFYCNMYFIVNSPHNLNK